MIFKCDQQVKHLRRAWLIILTLVLSFAQASGNSSNAIIIEQPTSSGFNHQLHLQPWFVFGARNKSINITRILVDESSQSVYVGAANWLLQLSLSNLRAEFALKTGPSVENSRDCAPGECQVQPLQVDLSQLPGSQHQFEQPNQQPNLRRPLQTMHTQHSLSNSSHVYLSARSSSSRQPLLTGAESASASATSKQQASNNYNKILAIDADSKQLIVCGSLDQGSCRRHQLGQLSNFTDSIPLPVAPNDEHSTSVALVVRQSRDRNAQILYVAATNSRLGPYRDMVPAISARYLEPSARSMQIIERSFTDLARVDISSELRDYYLVNYVHSFQHGEFVYFAQVQRRSPLRQLEEWGYISRLARICQSDLSFQSYTELTLECKLGSVNYNLMQDAQIAPAGSVLAKELKLRSGSQSMVLVASFAQSKDHTTRSSSKSAICLFALDKIEAKFNENIQLCYNGSVKSRNMNYIAGSVNDCPKAGVSSLFLIYSIFIS